MIYRQTKELAAHYRREANRLDNEWLRTADKRAVQGGAICDEADQLRKLALHLDRDILPVIEELVGKGS